MIHSVGGTLLQHIKEHRLHTDIRRGDVVFYFSTTGWMMWNWLVSVLASDATIVLFDGNPTGPDSNPATLFELAATEGFTHFGTSAKYLDSVNKLGYRPMAHSCFPALRTILSTGSVLSPESFDWVYRDWKADVSLASITGGTDILGCFALGDPTAPVRRGELQCPGLGMAVEVWGDGGALPDGEPGELVCTRSFPSSPTQFLNDVGGSKFHDAYFDQYQLCDISITSRSLIEKRRKLWFAYFLRCRYS
jgi:acetoacetyl-CoA synthetase